LNTNKQQLIATAHPEFSASAIAELKRLDKQLAQIDELAPGVILCTGAIGTYSGNDLSPADGREALSLRTNSATGQNRPIFVRHIAPVQTTIGLTNSPRDLEEIAVALAALPSMALLERGTHFAVQTRFVQTDKTLGERPYSSGQINQALAEVIGEETGAVEDVKKPQVVVSLLCTTHKGYLGISPVEENLSSWPGGARRFAQTPEQISRAEFKLLEALEVFGLQLPSQGRALDLGAAPGGWTRIALEAGLQVVAVDPARLDSRLAKQKRLDHYRGYAEDYLEEAIRKRYRFDIIMNDMRMDARDAARLLVKASTCLKTDGFVLSVFKLPHATLQIDPIITLKEALNILNQCYGIVQARQLFHNRQEVTVVAAQPH
jgi:23S rRNA (cytidine2498-2'-O)-methyltransferase